MKKIMIAALGFSLLSGSAVFGRPEPSTDTSSTMTKKHHKKSKKSTSTDTTSTTSTK